MNARPLGRGLSRKARISFVVPAYNCSRTIDECIESILHQRLDRSQYEVVIIDNNSTDDTAYKVRRYPVKLFHESKQGRSFARNRGILESNGEIVAFVDADCVLDPGFGKAVLKAFSDPFVGGAQAKCIPISRQKDSLLRFRKDLVRLFTDGTFVQLEVFSNGMPVINTGACAYRRTALSDVRGFDSVLVRGEDWDLSFRVFLSRWALASVPEAVAYCYFQGITWSDFLSRSYDCGKEMTSFMIKWRHFLPGYQDAKRKSLKLIKLPEFFKPDAAPCSRNMPFRKLQKIVTSYWAVGEKLEIWRLQTFERERLQLLKSNYPIYLSPDKPRYDRHLLLSKENCARIVGRVKNRSIRAQLKKLALKSPAVRLVLSENLNFVLGIRELHVEYGHKTYLPLRGAAKECLMMIIRGHGEDPQMIRRLPQRQFAELVALFFELNLIHITSLSHRQEQTYLREMASQKSLTKRYRLKVQAHDGICEQSIRRPINRRSVK